jgi:hypothetical protein
VLTLASARFIMHRFASSFYAVNLLTMLLYAWPRFTFAASAESHQGGGSKFFDLVRATLRTGPSHAAPEVEESQRNALCGCGCVL